MRLICSCRGIAYLQLNELKSALADVDKAINLNDSSAESYLYRGRIYYLLSNFEQSKIDLEKSIRLDGKSALAYLYRGNLYQSTGQLNRPLLILTGYCRLLPIRNKYHRQSRQLKIVKVCRNNRQVFYLGDFLPECTSFSRLSTGKRSRRRSYPGHVQLRYRQYQQPIAVLPFLFEVFLF